MSEKPTPSPDGTPTSKHDEKPPMASPSGTPISYLDSPGISRGPPPTGEVHREPVKEVVYKPPKRKPARKPVRKIGSNISSTMISWNEATTIDLTLRSVVGLVDEVIIVDTGSFDGTPKIAREWMDELNLSGEVKQVRVKNLAQARLQAIQLCVTKWMIMQDANLVLSESLKKEIKSHIKGFPDHQLAVKSLNLFGDYEHYFSALPFMAHHRIVMKTDAPYSQNTERQYFHMPSIDASFWAVNLSRVRPAWRYWYRGEPFDREKYTPKGLTPEAKGHMHEGNRQYQWHTKTRYPSMVEFIQATMGLSLEDVKKISPSWYLKYLQKEAVPLTDDIRRNLPEVIKQEMISSRYKLIKKDGEIIGRWPEL